MFPVLPIQFFAVSGLINGVLSLGLGILVYLRGRRNPLFQTFLLLNLSIAAWSFSYWRWLSQTDFESALMWARILDIGAIFIPITFLHWAMTLLGQQDKKKYLLLFGYLLSVFFLVFSFSPFFVRTVEPALYFPFWPKPGLLYTVFFIVSFVGFTLLSLFELFRVYLRETGLRRLQLKFVLLGFLIGFAGGATNFLLWYGIPVPPIGNIFVSAYPLIFSYAIIRHRLLDVRLAVRSLIVKLLLALLLFSGYGLYKFYFGSVHSQLRVTLGDWTAFVFLLVVVFLYERIDRFVRVVTDHFLFQREYSHQEMIHQLGKMITQSLEVKPLMDNIRQTLIEVMRVSYVGFILLPKGPVEGENGLPTGTLLVDGLNPELRAYLGTSFIFKRLKEEAEVLSFDELKRWQSEVGGEQSDRELTEILKDFEKLGAAVTIPLLTTEGVAGAIFIGEKKGGNAFTTSDFETFEMLKFQAGVALENALLFARTKDFNITLKKEVRRATGALANRNRRLTVLRRLDMIIMNTLDPDEMAQKIIDTVSWEMGYEGGLIALLDGDSDTLRAYAVSSTPLLKKAIALIPKSIKKITISCSKSPGNLLVKALRERRPLPSDNYVELFSPALPAALSETISKITHIPHNVVYPLSAKGRPLGVVVFGLSQPYEKLPAEEKELLSAFMDEAGIAIENVTLYAQAKKDKEDLEIAYAKLQDLDKMKDDFISITSHELRTPMSSIKGYLWMLENKGDALSARQKGYLEKAKRGADRMINLINDMLSVSRIEQGRIELKIVSFDLKDVIKEVAESLKVKAAEKGLVLSAVAESVFVEADPDKIREVIGNLTENAIKYTSTGTILVTVKKTSRAAKVSVKDTGKGIAEADIPRLFKKFGRLESSFATVAETSGTGLGLYISKLLVEKQGGTIGVSSKPGQGSTFWFSLPVSKAKAGSEVVREVVNLPQ
ncbi:MAG: ATP-binding protein [Patescibacteria group bacterium]